MNFSKVEIFKRFALVMMVALMGMGVTGCKSGGSDIVLPPSSTPEAKQLSVDASNADLETYVAIVEAAHAKAQADVGAALVDVEQLLESALNFEAIETLLSNYAGDLELQVMDVLESAFNGDIANSEVAAKVGDLLEALGYPYGNVDDSDTAYLQLLDLIASLQKGIPSDFEGAKASLMEILDLAAQIEDEQLAIATDILLAICSDENGDVKEGNAYADFIAAIAVIINEAQVRRSELAEGVYDGLLLASQKLLSGDPVEVKEGVEILADVANKIQTEQIVLARAILTLIIPHSDDYAGIKSVPAIGDFPFWCVDVVLSLAQWGVNLNPQIVGWIVNSPEKIIMLIQKYAK